MTGGNTSEFRMGYDNTEQNIFDEPKENDTAMQPKAIVGID